jgi:muconolactone delta-isomerase
MTESPKEKELQRIAAAKSDAYRTLAAGNPVEAYRLFLELRKLAPDDADIEEYLKQSLEEARKISFFKDEVTRLSRYPSAGRIFFRVKADERTELFVACDSVYFGVEQAYLAGLEYLSVSLGKPVLKAVAPYAKLQGDRLLIACYDRDDPRNAFLPSFPVKDVKLTFTNYLTVPFGIKDLKIAAIAAGSPAEASIIDLISIYRQAARIGADGMPFIKEGLMRIQACVAFLLISLFCVYLGFRFRHRGEKSQLAGALLSFPISVFMAGIALEAWAWFNGTVVSILLRTMPALSVTFFIVIQGIALALAFIILAGYRDAPSD